MSTITQQLTLKQIRERLHFEADNAAWQADQQYRLNSTEPVFLWFKASRPGEWGALFVSYHYPTDYGAEWELVRLSGREGGFNAGQTIEANTAEVLERLRRLPALPL